MWRKISWNGNGRKFRHIELSNSVISCQSVRIWIQKSHMDLTGSESWFWLLSRYGWLVGWLCRIPTCSPCSTTSWGTPTTGRSLTGTGDPSPAFYCIIVFNSPPRSWVLLLYCTVVTVRSAAPFRSFRVLQSCLGGSIIYFRWLWVTTDILSYNNTLMRVLKIKYKYVILVKFILQLLTHLQCNEVFLTL